MDLRSFGNMHKLESMYPRSSATTSCHIVCIFLGITNYKSYQKLLNYGEDKNYCFQSKMKKHALVCLRAILRRAEDDLKKLIVSQPLFYNEWNEAFGNPWKILGTSKTFATKLKINNKKIDAVAVNKAPLQPLITNQLPTEPLFDKYDWNSLPRKLALKLGIDPNLENCKLLQCNTIGSSDVNS